MQMSEMIWMLSTPQNSRNEPSVTPCLPRILRSVRNFGGRVRCASTLRMPGHSNPGLQNLPLRADPRREAFCGRVSPDRFPLESIRSRSVHRISIHSRCERNISCSTCRTISRSGSVHGCIGRSRRAPADIRLGTFPCPLCGQPVLQARARRAAQRIGYVSTEIIPALGCVFDR